MMIWEWIFFCSPR